MTSQRTIGNWGDVDVDIGGVSIGPIAALVLGLALVSAFLILVGNGANWFSQQVNFQTGQPISNFGSSVAGVGYAILALLAIGFVIVVIIWARSQSNSEYA